LHASLSHEAKHEGVSLNAYVCHLLSERNAFQKLKSELEKKIVVVVDPLSEIAKTSNNPYIYTQPIVDQGLNVSAETLKLN
jgi:hypothetical protein